MLKYKFKLRVLFIILFTTPLFVFSQSWQLVWQDEFMGTEINTQNWTHEIGGNGWGNNELQYYTNRSDNSYIEDGKLVIQANKENYLGKDYTSARIITSGKQSWQYGRVEARIKLPFGKGIWPAFWMLGESIFSIGWPQCGEIDIMEMVGGTSGDKVTHGTAHWDQTGSHASYGGTYTLSTGIFADDYHLFTIEWTPQSIKWLMDGQQYHVIDITPAELSEFHEKFFIILNVAVGGDWPGSPDGTTIFPQKMYVDYVRFYADESSVPNISISSPIDNSIVEPYSNVNISTNIDFDDEISLVEFYQGAMKIGQTNVSPYEMTWRNLYPGCYKITAKANGENGYTGTSRVVNLQSGSDCIEAPYFGTPFEIPGEIEIENFNIGDAGVAFSDNDVINAGGQYRLTNQVDIENCDDLDGGYNVGWIEPSEWLKYIINVNTTGSYNFDFRVASQNQGGKLHIEINGSDITGSINIPATGGWQTWETISEEGISLTKGVHEMKIVFEAGGFNFNRLDIFDPTSIPSLELLYPSGGETLGIGNVAEIRWNSLKVKNVSIGFSTNGGTSWDFVTQTTPALFGSYRWEIPNVNSNDCLIMILDKDNSSLRAISNSPFTIDIPNSVKNGNQIVKDFALFQNYPNPFNPVTNIEYSIAENLSSVFLQQYVSLKVYDSLGKLVATLVNKHQLPGKYSVQFNSNDLSSGTYFYKLKCGNFTAIKKALLMK